MTKYPVIFLSTAAVLILQGCPLRGNSIDLTDTNETTDVSGTYLQIGDQDPNEGQLSGKNLNTVQINASPLAVNFSTTKVGINDKEAGNSTAYSRYIISDAFYQQTRFGIANTGKEVYIFAQGHPTLQMPKQGQSIYNGHAAVSLNGYLGAASAISNVDFAKNTLQVSISTPEQQPQEIVFNAVIRGNTFAGDKDIISSGGFYGKDAAELGGYFIQNTKNYGAFGGKKFFGVRK